MARDTAELEEVLHSVSDMLKPFYAQVAALSVLDMPCAPRSCVILHVLALQAMLGLSLVHLVGEALMQSRMLQMTAAKRSVSLGVMDDLLSAEAQSAGQMAAWRKSKGLPMLGPASADICKARCCYL